METVDLVKYCPVCGQENPRATSFCSHCPDGDLSTVSTEPRRVSQVPAAGDGEAAESGEEVGTRRVSAGAHAVCTLELVSNPTVRFQVCDGQTVGRNDRADVVLRDVPDLDAISGAHARFFRRGDQWYAQHIGVTNFIRVDGEVFQDDTEVGIQDGTVIVLTLTPFRVAT